MDLHDLTVIHWTAIWVRSLLGLGLAGLVLGCLLGAVAFVLGVVLLLVGGLA